MSEGATAGEAEGGIPGGKMIPGGGGMALTGGGMNGGLLEDKKTAIEITNFSYTVVFTLVS